MGFLNTAWWIWGILALGVALMFVVFVPRSEKVRALHGMTFVIVRWFHSLVWVLLAVSFFLRATENETAVSLANPTSMAAGVVYVLYLVTMVRTLR
jgi:cbb3-type cytochrome oxidase subunit 1